MPSGQLEGISFQGSRMNLMNTIVILALGTALFVPSAKSADEIRTDASSMIAQGDKQWAEGKLDDARNSFELAVAANPGATDAPMKLAGLFLASGKYSNAIQTYQKAIGLDAKNARVWIGLGMAYLHTGQKALSQAAFEEAIRLEPSRKSQLAKLTESSGGH
jgi:Tfp pilus assembly protein PilF